MSEFTRALILAAQAHQEQKDKSGEDYILHCLRVALHGENEDERIVGVLHDIVEDTDMTVEGLRRMGFEPHLVEAVRLLTKIPNEPNIDYIDRLKTNRLARRVKQNDLADNMDPRRLANLPPHDSTRLIIKYTAAQQRLDEYARWERR